MAAQVSSKISQMTHPLLIPKISVGKCFRRLKKKIRNTKENAHAKRYINKRVSIFFSFFLLYREILEFLLIFVFQLDFLHTIPCVCELSLKLEPLRVRYSRYFAFLLKENILISALVNSCIFGIFICVLRVYLPQYICV